MDFCKISVSSASVAKSTFSSKAMSELVGGLSANGKLIAIGVSFDPLGVSPVQLILG